MAARGTKQNTTIVETFAACQQKTTANCSCSSFSSISN